MIEGSYWFKRILKDIKRIDKNLRVVRAKYGFYRIYYKQIYVHELYKELGPVGHDIEEYDIRLQDKKYFEEYEDVNEITRKIKNYKEGYWDALGTITRRVWMMRHNKEYYNIASNAYKQVVIK